MLANLRTISKTILEEFCQVRFESASLSTKGPHNKGKSREYSVLLLFERLPIKYSCICFFHRLPRNQSRIIETTQKIRLSET